MKTTFRILMLTVAMAWSLSSAYAQVTHRSDRPSVGLVLGGGGALGLSHVGVLKVLEAQRVPIDYIVGTSMGSIIAGLYATGMSPDEIESFLAGLDWDEVMSDRTARRELYFRRKLDDQRYLFEMGVGRRGLKLGTGVAAGQKFNNLMEIATLRSAHISDFDSLPVPYRAVATDLISGSAYIISSGRVSRAMRSSMAVPGVFTPVEFDGRLLVDGGVVNNLPVDVAKAMGADVVIAVDVGATADTVDPASFRTFVGILGRTYTIAQRPKQIENFKRADIGIQPDLSGLTASQFSRVQEFVPRGVDAAMLHAAEISKFSVSEDAYAEFLSRQRRSRPEAPVIKEVRVSGNQRVSEKIIRGRISQKAGDRFDPTVLEKDLRRIYGIGEFEQILFRLDGPEQAESILCFDAMEKPSGPAYLKYGLRLSSDFDAEADWAMLLNWTRMSINKLGAEWRVDVEAGNTQDIFTEFYQPLENTGLFFLAPSAEYKSEPESVYEDDQRIAEYDVSTLMAYLDVGCQPWPDGEFRIGPVWGTGNAEVETGSAELPEFDEDLSGYRARWMVDRQDRTVLPREGYQLHVQGISVTPDLGGDADYDKLDGWFRAQHSMGKRTFQVGLRGGSSLNSTLPGYAQFTLGGPFSFSGLADDQFRGSYLGVASIGYRHRLVRMPAQLGRGLYAITRLDCGNVWPDEFDTDDVLYGGLAGLAADTVVGPILLGYGHAEGGYDRLYFSLGTAF